ncbi:hypothetical protein [Treponema brennaborense]|uniref:Uncharacterized protein n=1 Tax=Treponema brennaborense (strain DSM 12168 / CIP 105900 / DD5/3) TaxID=906968 RepID=F4LNS5_TREBD|nr:hypothetical protein [Treponema brennaborense]AEE16910.1 hypothetical protein Trebr_1486 [Treponema brennaborense DSM 12168]
MSESTIWKDEKYTEVFEEELRGIERRMANDTACTIDDIKGILDHLYISEGNNWEGRGPLGDTVMAATIAAYEQFIADYRAR